VFGLKKVAALAQPPAVPLTVEPAIVEIPTSEIIRI
jgi:hypothetical protein